MQWRGVCGWVGRAPEHAMSSSEKTERHHGNAVSIRQGSAHVAESKLALGKEGNKRGRDAAAVDAADKESQLCPHILNLIIL